MRNRLWIIILLIVWIGQWAVSTADPLLTQSEPGWRGCLSVKNLAYLVTFQVRHRWFWPASRSQPVAEHGVVDDVEERGDLLGGGLCWRRSARQRQHRSRRPMLRRIP
ncbi:MAG: hypothetical protein ACE5LU_15610 [Anaerolineae bacterium]